MHWVNRRKSGHLLAASLAFTASVSALPAQAQSVEEFYHNHPLNLMIGFPVANAYDTYGRAVARHLGKHIPGNPTVVPLNRPGAGGLNLANFLYNAAPKDGSTIAIFNRAISLDPLMGITEARFDARKFAWLGSVGNEVSVCVAWHESPVKNWNDLITKNFIAASASRTTDTYAFAQVIKEVFGAKIKIITGYPGGNEMSLAMESREVDGRCGWSWSGVKSSKPDWLADHKINVLVQLGLRKSDELPDVPLITDLATTDDQRAILKLIFGRQEFAWPFMGPPEIPADRKKALVDGFAATMKDPQFLEDAKKIQIDVNPVSGADVERLLGNLYEAPEPIVAKVRNIVNAQ